MKRYLLALILIWTVGPLAYAIPITRIYGESPSPQFLQSYYERLYRWHDNQNKINQSLPDTAKQLIATWKPTLTRWGAPLENGQVWNYFYFKHTVTDGILKYPGVFIGAKNWPQESYPLIVTIAKQHGFTLKPELLAHFFGFCWGPDGQLEIHFLFESSNLKGLSTELQALSNSHSTNEWSSSRLAVLAFDKSKTKIDEKLIVSLNEINWKLIEGISLDALSAQKIISTTKGVRWKFDLRSIAETSLSVHSRLVTKGLAQSLHLYPTSISYRDSNNYTLYYP